MNVQDQGSRVQTQAPIADIDHDPSRVELRHPWQTPEVTQLEIRRTMNSSGQSTDGITSAPLPPP